MAARKRPIKSKALPDSVDPLAADLTKLGLSDDPQTAMRIINNALSNLRVQVPLPDLKQCRSLAEETSLALQCLRRSQAGTLLNTERAASSFCGLLIDLKMLNHAANELVSLSAGILRLYHESAYEPTKIKGTIELTNVCLNFPLASDSTKDETGDLCHLVVQTQTQALALVLRTVTSKTDWIELARRLVTALGAVGTILDWRELLAKRHTFTEKAIQNLSRIDSNLEATFGQIIKATTNLDSSASTTAYDPDDLLRLRLFGISSLLATPSLSKPLTKTETAAARADAFWTQFRRIIGLYFRAITALKKKTQITEISQVLEQIWHTVRVKHPSLTIGPMYSTVLDDILKHATVTDDHVLRSWVENQLAASQSEQSTSQRIDGVVLMLDQLRQGNPAIGAIARLEEMLPKVESHTDLDDLEKLRGSCYKLLKHLHSAEKADKTTVDALRHALHALISIVEPLLAKQHHTPTVEGSIDSAILLVRTRHGQDISLSSDILDKVIPFISKSRPPSKLSYEDLEVTSIHLANCLASTYFNLGVAVRKQAADPVTGEAQAMSMFKRSYDLGQAMLRAGDIDHAQRPVLIKRFMALSSSYEAVGQIEDAKAVCLSALRTYRRTGLSEACSIEQLQVDEAQLCLLAQTYTKLAEHQANVVLSTVSLLQSLPSLDQATLALILEIQYRYIVRKFEAPNSDLLVGILKQCAVLYEGANFQLRRQRILCAIHEESYYISIRNATLFDSHIDSEIERLSKPVPASHPEAGLNTAYQFHFASFYLMKALYEFSQATCRDNSVVESIEAAVFQLEQAGPAQVSKESTKHHSPMTRHSTGSKTSATHSETPKKSHEQATAVQNIRESVMQSLVISLLPIFYHIAAVLSVIGKNQLCIALSRAIGSHLDDNLPRDARSFQTDLAKRLVLLQEDVEIAKILTNVAVSSAANADASHLELLLSSAVRLAWKGQRGAAKAQYGEALQLVSTARKSRKNPAQIQLSWLQQAAHAILAHYTYSLIQPRPWDGIESLLQGIRIATSVISIKVGPAGQDIDVFSSATTIKETNLPYWLGQRQSYSLSDLKSISDTIVILPLLYMTAIRACQQRGSVKLACFLLDRCERWAVEVGAKSLQQQCSDERAKLQTLSTACFIAVPRCNTQVCGNQESTEQTLASGHSSGAAPYLDDATKPVRLKEYIASNSTLHSERLSLARSQAGPAEYLDSMHLLSRTTSDLALFHYRVGLDGLQKASVLFSKDAILAHVEDMAFCSFPVSKRNSAAKDIGQTLQTAQESLRQAWTLAIDNFGTKQCQDLALTQAHVCMLHCVLVSTVSANVSKAVDALDTTAHITFEREIPDSIRSKSRKSEPAYAWPDTTAEEPPPDTIDDALERWQHLMTGVKRPSDVARSDWLPSRTQAIQLAFDTPRNRMLLVRHTRSCPPVIFSIPLDRCWARDGEDEEPRLTFEVARIELHSILAETNASCQTAKHIKTSEARQAWWQQREELECRLRDLLQAIELRWLGTFKSIFRGECDLAGTDLDYFRKTIDATLARYIPKPVKPVQKHYSLSAQIVEVFARLPATCPDEDIDDWLQLVLDSWQMSGLQPNHDEVDHDQTICDLRMALERYSTNAASQEKSTIAHTFLILDKQAQPFPWESLQHLQGHSLSRVPSLAFLQHMLQMRAGRSNGSTNRGTVDDPVQLSFTDERTFFILNPAGDLAKTQTGFQTFVDGLSHWRGITNRIPMEMEFKAALAENDLFVYVGHGGGEQYIRSQVLRTLPQCAVAFLWGCSSGTLHDMGDFDPHGTPLHYLAAGCPALVGNLWDVTDKDIDKFTFTCFDKAGIGRSDSATRKTIGEAVAESRSACLMRYLNGAAPVVYGLPMQFR